MKTRHLTLTLALAAAVAAAPLWAAAKERSSSSGKSGGGRSSSAVSRHSGGSRSSSGVSSRSGTASRRSSVEGRHPGSRSGRHSGRHYSGRRYYRDRNYYGHSSYYWGSPYSWSWGWYPFGYSYDGWYPGYYGYGGWGPRYYAPARWRNVGSVRLQVQPEQAEVYVDGGYAGQVDEFNGVFQRLRVRPGRHELTFKCEGYKTHRMRAHVPVDGTLRIRYRMEPGASTEETASVVGRPEDEAEEGLAEGDEPADDEVAEAEAETAEAAPATAEVQLEVQPADAAVYIDGKFAGNADDVEDLDLAPGRHRLEVVRPGHATFEKDIEVTAGQPLKLKVSLERTTSS